jgi:hypothetical protein
MTTSDWLLDIALLLVVFRQLREGRIDARFVLLPVGIVSIVAHSYLHSIPAAGNDLLLIGALVGVGAVLGVAGGLTTRVRYDGRHSLAQAGWIAAALWIVGMGSRMTFQLWSDHGGETHIAHFSQVHDITSSQAWVSAFVLMALTEVLTRVGTIVYRGWRAQQSAPVTNGRESARPTRHLV